MKTIKQLAEIYGVSKQAIRQRVNKLPLDCYQVGTNNTIYVNEKGLEILGSQMSSKVSSEVSSKGVNLDTNALILELRQKIALLEFEKEIQDKNTAEKIELIQRELDKKDAHIEQLLNLLNQEQQLHALAQQKVMLLEQKNEEPKPRWKFWKPTKSNDN